MKCIAVPQPLCSLLASGAIADLRCINVDEKVEHVGDLLLGASDFRQDIEDYLLDKFKIRTRSISKFVKEKPLPTNSVVGVVKFVKCVKDFQSRWARAGKWHLVVSHPYPLPAEPLSQPIEPGLFDYVPKSNELLQRK